MSHQANNFVKKISAGHRKTRGAKTPTQQKNARNVAKKCPKWPPTGHQKCTKTANQQPGPRKPKAQKAQKCNRQRKKHTRRQTKSKHTTKMTPKMQKRMIF